MNNQVLSLTSPIMPSVNHYLKTRAIIKNGKPMALMYETSEAKQYKKEFAKYVKQQVEEQNWIMSKDKTQHIYCDCVFYFDRAGKDCNNYFKLLLDSITESECVWIDDKIVCERVNRIYYDSSNPRIELTIYPVEYVGIFDDDEELECFENNCKTCTRYTRNCSILNNAKTGRIQEEICNLTCNKYKLKKEKKK